MSGRGATPPNKDPSRKPQSSSKFRTPPNLNSTHLDASVRGSKTRSNSKFIRGTSCSHLDVTGIGGASRVPAVKANLTPQVDYELECDLADCDYLQALMKKAIAAEGVEKHEEEINDQLAIQRDNLFKSRLKCKEATEELTRLEQLEEVNKLVETMKNNFDRFHALKGNIDLEETLEQVLCLFQAFCSRLTVKNVKPLQTEEDFRKLEVVLKECLTAFQRLNLQDRNPKQVNHLAEVMRKYQEQVRQAAEKQKFMNSAQENEVFKLFKSLSQKYVKREQYKIACDEIS